MPLTELQRNDLLRYMLNLGEPNRVKLSERGTSIDCLGLSLNLP